MLLNRFWIFVRLSYLYNFFFIVVTPMTSVQLSQTMTIVIVTHNMQQAARVSDYCAFFLSDGGPGQLIEADLTTNIFSNPGDQRTADYVQGRFG